MKGSYVLILKMESNQVLKIGKIGEIEFRRGFYSYVGSANGKNLGIDERLKRYFKLNKEKKGNLRWHIDYLLVNNNVKIIDVVKTKKEECELARIIEKISSDLIPNFGCSDCNCESHLFFHFSNPKEKIIKFI
ncbi:MAG: GIY-YIG nuclease family protein [Candidatus Aenigmatarchaeota archaeon]